ncbi:hypothetical protein DGN11_07720 [Xanthomonas citri pv. fuscans]|nr:hypothetical protein DGN11_07720 [Xanthomonas citri pv. fuscans]
MAPRGGAIWPSAGAETYGGVHPWRDLTGTRSLPYGSRGGCEGGVGSSGIGNRELGIGNRDSGFGIRDSSGKHSAQLRALPVPRHGAAEMSGWLSPAAAPRSPRAAHPACQAGRTAGRNR